MASAIALNGRISREIDPEGLLRLVADEHANFNDVNMATAFSKFGKLCGHRSFPRNIAADDGFRGLLVRARDMCAEGWLDPQAVANIIHAVSKMSAARKLAAADAGIQEVLGALEQRVVRVASDMKPQEVSNTVYGLALLGRMPGAEARAALEVAVARVGPDMEPQHVANIWWAYATLDWEPGAEARAALEVAVERLAPGMTAQAVANTVLAHATLRLMPGVEAQTALEVAVVRVGPSMTAQAVANTVHAHATLGLTPGSKARAALEAAMVRVGPSMDAQNISNTLGGLLTSAATRDVPLPTCYPSLWLAASELDVGSLQDLRLCNLFHARLIHTELVSGDVLDEVTFPPWIMTEARAAWMRQVRGDVTVSNNHRQLASIIGDLGVPYEVECLADDGNFSVDVFLTVDDVAVEFDGPTHFINTSDNDAAPRTRKTMKTELRDMFLRRRYRTVLSVPHFEWEVLRGSAEKKAYVEMKLRAVGVSIPASP
jgi:hypothetical protein